MDPRVLAARTERWLPVVALLAVVVGIGLALTVRDATPVSVLVLAVGVAVQLAATAVLSLAPRRSSAGFLAVLAVAAALTCLPGAWRQLSLVGAVPWIPLTVAWASVRVSAVDDEDRVQRLRPAATAAVAYLAVVAVWGPGPATSATLGAAAPLLGGLSVGLALLLRRARVRRAEAERARRDADVLRARAEEREHLATALHDDLGHVLTLVVLQATTLAARPDVDVTTSARTIGDLGRRGLAALRAALQLVDDPTLTTSDVEPSEPALLAGLRDLAADARTAGQDVTVQVPTTVRGVDGPGQAALLRAAREALTNALRHSPGAPVRIGLVDGPDALLRLTVTNAAPRVAVSDTSGSGRGLAALARGVDLLGGTISHGPADDGGYALRVELPRALVR